MRRKLGWWWTGVAIGGAALCGAAVAAVAVAPVSGMGTGDVAIARAADSRWTPQRSGVTARLRGVSAVSARVAWASGADGTILRTVDGGATWLRRPVPGAETLDFRDIDAIDDRVAYALSIGPGEASRIMKTVDGGATWQTQFINRDPKAFLDAMAFSSATHGVAISDAVDGAHVVLVTHDGGREWTRVPPASLPPALAGEGAFAASGTNVATWGRDLVWIATNAPGPAPAAAPAPASAPAPVSASASASADSGRGGSSGVGSGASVGASSAGAAGSHAGPGIGASVSGGAGGVGTSRVLRSRDGGRTWAVATTPLAAGASAGIFSIAFRDARHGIIVGGDYKKEADAVDNVAWTADGGVTWTLVRTNGLSGFRSAVAYVPRASTARSGRASGRAASGSGSSSGGGSGGGVAATVTADGAGAGAGGGDNRPPRLIAVGPLGADESLDDGRTWRPLAIDGPGFHAFSIAHDGRTAWGVGEQGRIARLDLSEPR